MKRKVLKPELSLQRSLEFSSELQEVLGVRGEDSKKNTSFLGVSMDFVLFSIISEIAVKL
jgi:hypothetical protein